MEKFAALKQFSLDDLICSTATDTNTAPDVRSQDSPISNRASDFTSEGTALAQEIPISSVKPKSYFPQVNGEEFLLKNLDTGEALDILSSKILSVINKELSLAEEDEIERELWYAAKSNNSDLVKEILENIPAKFTYKNHEMGPLHVAASEGNVSVCEAMLDYGQVDINEVARYGRNALHMSCEEGHLTTIQLLVRSGADINIQDEEGQTPMHILAEKGANNIVKWFLNRNPCMTVENKDGKIPLEVCESDTCRDLIISKMPVGRFDRVGPSDFEIQKIIGKGSFGDVYLVDKECKQYAMKVLSKEQITERNLMKYAITERNVLTRIKHPFIVELHYAFQTSEKLFLILEFCHGGDLSFYLARAKKFTEDVARLYLAEIFLAIEELHSHNIIYRDLKPSNIVLDKDGHCKLTDFGLSKQGILTTQAAKSFCGSVAYLAPEILAQQGHGKAVDWYLLGVLMYEMLVGIPPFYDRSNDLIFHKIQNAKLKIPSRLSKPAKDLIIRLLQRNPEKRLGFSSASEIKKHPFFASIDWDAAVAKQLKVPSPCIQKFNAPDNLTQARFEKTSDPKTHIIGWSFIKG